MEESAERRKRLKMLAAQAADGGSGYSTGGRGAGPALANPFAEANDGPAPGAAFNFYRWDGKAHNACESLGMWPSARMCAFWTRSHTS